MSNSQKPKPAARLAQGAVKLVTKAMSNTKAAKALEAAKRNQDKK